MTIYAMERVAWAWLLDPIQTHEVFQLEGDRWSMLDTWRGDALVRAFDAIELELAALWQR